MPKPKCDEDDSEHQYWEVIKMALNAERRCDDGSERQNRECNSERQTRKWWWCWMSKPKMRWGWLWTLILRSDNDGFERRTKMWWWLWMSKLRSDNDGSERRTKICNGFERQNESRQWLWTPKRRCGSERRNGWCNDAERQSEKRRWLWTPNEEVALNVELKVWHDDSECRKPRMNDGSERQTARKWWGGNMPQCGMTLQILIR